MNYHLSDIETLLTVAETGSFRAAAFSLGVGQPAVSRRVQRLEDKIGVSFFERRTTGVFLTNAGRQFVDKVRLLYSEFQSAVSSAQDAGASVRGCLSVGLIASLSRGPYRNIVEALNREHGGFEFCFEEAERSYLYTLLNQRRLDAVIAAGEPNLRHGESLLIAREKLFLAVPEMHSWSRTKALGWHDVRDATFIVSVHEPGPEIGDYILRHISDVGHSIRIRRHRLGREGIMTLVGLGHGVSLVADHWRGVQYPNVVFIPIGGEEETVPFSLTWRPENDNPALRRLISLARIEAKRNGALS